MSSEALIWKEKKSKISELMKEMRNLAPEERAGYGKSVNELKEWGD